MLRRSMPLGVIVVLLLSIITSSFLTTHSSLTQAAASKTGVADQSQDTGINSTHHESRIWAIAKNGKTTILQRVCGTGPKYQLATEYIGHWTEIYPRTDAANGCSPSPTLAWIMAVDADPGNTYRIFSASYETFLPEKDFLQRAQRSVCTVVSLGQLRCNRETVTVPKAYIDAPGSNQTLKGTVTVRGWAADLAATSGTGVDKVQVYAGNKLLGNASYGQTREDVARAYGDSRFTKSGYIFQFDTRTVPNGATTLRVQYRSKLTNQWSSVTKSVSINNSSDGPPPASHTDTKLTGAIENGKTTIFLQVCGEGQKYRFRSERVVDKAILWDQTYGAVDGCSSKYRAVIGAKPGEQFRFYSTVMNTSMSDNQFLQTAHRHACVVNPTGDIKCQNGNTPPPPTEPGNPPSPSPAKCAVPHFWQQDPAWRNHPLRSNGACSAYCGTIGTCGCTLTSAAMVFRYYGANINPPQLSDCMGQLACPFYWGTGGACSGGKASFASKESFSWAGLDRKLNRERRPVILGMSYRNGNTHWIVVTGGNGSNPANYTINDPGYKGGASMRLNAYGPGSGWQLREMATYTGQRLCDTTQQVTQTTETIDPLVGTATKVPDNVAEQTEVRDTITAPLDQVLVYHTTDLTMTLELTPPKLESEASEMLIWTDSISNTTWQPYTSYVAMPASEKVYVRFRDQKGKTSEDAVAIRNPAVPLPESVDAYNVFLPLLRR
ncbi:MAG: hypothetical protein GFH27_549281n134 [Chloroflexi bacterium AL-W]|nr:hypothetical protein [Chloroflexi bacterium AL-N1]NOK66020.1 hypothetical protein [Chloroflexi bacterium AL-N10]NOK72901.1 hypothetical protein [Chloroflexi bacterium AL-N5]NOK79798.1 hypothetical protein [Chloroflexi bacterium AL-W]NOK88346.1 hypothetical protein [Chloroflexi bacterium AL-N15]